MSAQTKMFIPLQICCVQVRQLTKCVKSYCSRQLITQDNVMREKRNGFTCISEMNSGLMCAGLGFSQCCFNYSCGCMQARHALFTTTAGHGTFTYANLTRRTSGSSAVRSDLHSDWESGFLLKANSKSFMRKYPGHWTIHKIKHTLRHNELENWPRRLTNRDVR